MRTVVALSVLATMWAVGPTYTGYQEGTITLEGYNAAFALCVEEHNDDMVALDDMTIIVYKNYTLYIDSGHEFDSELVNLRTTALIECN